MLRVLLLGLLACSGKELSLDSGVTDDDDRRSRSGEATLPHHDHVGDADEPSGDSDSGFSGDADGGPDDSGSWWDSDGDADGGSDDSGSEGDTGGEADDDVDSGESEPASDSHVDEGPTVIKVGFDVAPVLGVCEP